MAAVALRYARALADIVLRKGAGITPEQALEQVRAFEELIDTSDDLRNVLLSPSVPPARKRAVVKQIGEQLGTSRIICHFMYVVIDHRRIPMLGEIRKAFQNHVDEVLGIVRADVTAALELTERQRGIVTEKLSQLTGKRVESRFSVDPDLLGGIVARIGSTIYDGSVRGQLTALRRKLVSEV
jgi:F-type H+-transporting ATPase subunit delta